MKIIWLEDDPSTIRSNVDRIKNELNAQIEICECFAEFSEELDGLKDSFDSAIIIDIRMLFGVEHEFSCFDKQLTTVKKELDAGFEYFKECIEGKFSKTKIIFFTSKPYKEAILDAKHYDIDGKKIITKDDINRLILFLKGKK